LFNESNINGFILLYVGLIKTMEYIKALHEQSDESGHDFMNISIVIRSLKKSKVRQKIFLYLYKIYPKAAYLAEISKNTKIDAPNVLGALKGMGNRYKKSKSLVEMGLVEVIKVEGFSYYKISEKGKEMLRKIMLHKGGI